MPFRILTWNIQCLVDPSGIADRSEERAERVAAVLMATPPEDQPDLIAFNELFHDDARDILVTQLSAAWPHSIPKFDQASDPFANPSAIITQDSGLALFSKYPLRAYSYASPLGPEPVVFAKYNDAVLSDTLAAKGVGLSYIDHPQYGRVAIAISHLQASYSEDEQSSPDNVALSGGHTYTPTEFASIRAKQLGGAVGFLEMLMGPNESWPPTIFMGDFNIEAAMAGVPTGEYRDVFDPGGVLHDLFHDAWPTFISWDDLGYSQSDGVTGVRNRLDVVCVSHAGGSPDYAPLQAHHMRTLHRSYSDHYAVETLLNRPSPNSCPRQAMDSPTLAHPSGLQAYHLTIAHRGAYQWVLIRDPGTYTIFPGTDVEHVVYAVDDLSDPWPIYDDTRNDINQMGLGELTRDWDREGGLKGSGTVQAVADRPFFIRVRADRSLDPNFTGPTKLAIWRHTGATRETAIAILPQRELADPRLPAAVLKPYDECWFKAVIERAHTGAAHQSTFTIVNASGGNAKVVLIEEDGAQGPSAAGDNDLTLTYDHPGRTGVHLVLSRDQVSQADFKVGWRTALTFVRDDNTVKPFMIRCVDETGVDLLGDDEFRLRAMVDTEQTPFLSIDWDDADSGEYYPRGDMSIPPTGFLESIKVDAWEVDTFLAGAVWGPNILPLPDDVLEQPYGETFRVDSGKYRLELTLGRESTRGGAR